MEGAAPPLPRKHLRGSLITLAADNGKLKPNLSNSPLKTALEAGCQTV